MSAWEEDGSLVCCKCKVTFDVHEWVSPECDGEEVEEGESMRVNVYAEELTERLEIISKEIEGKTFTGLRFYLALPVTIQDAEGNPQYQTSGPFIHHKGDDDSAAVTFWGKRDLRTVMRRALELLDKHYAAQAEKEKRASQQEAGTPLVDDGLFGSTSVQQDFYRPVARHVPGYPRSKPSEGEEKRSSITGFSAPFGELRCPNCNSWDVRREDEESVRCCDCRAGTDYYEAWKQAHPNEDQPAQPKDYPLPSLAASLSDKAIIVTQSAQLRRQRAQIDAIRSSLVRLYEMIREA